MNEKYFGDGCPYFIGQFGDDGLPDLVFCRHNDNRDKNEGNCNKTNCPLMVMEPRKLSEILQIVLDNSGKCQYSGICALIAQLSNDKVLADEEADIASEYVRQNKPKSEFLKWNPISSYHFDLGDWTARRRYLRYRIKKLKAQGL